MNPLDAYTRETPPDPTDGRRFSVRHAEITRSRAMARHSHEEIEFFFVLPQGGSNLRLKLRVENEEFILCEGEAVLIPPSLSHYAEILAGRSCAYSTVCFHPLIFSGKGFRRFIQPLLLDSQAFVLKLSGETDWQREALGVLAKTARYGNMPDIESWELEFHGLMFILWNLIYKNAYADSPVIHAYQKLYKRMAGPIEYIHRHYQEDISEEVLAAQGSMAVGTLYRYFKKLMGITPFQYLSKYRILQSRTLLVQTDKMISEIASLCGYNSLTCFNREFKKYMNCTPSAYRKGSVCGTP